MTTETYEILDRAEHSDDPVAKQMAANFRAWIAASDAVVAAKAAQVVAHSEAQARVASRHRVRKYACIDRKYALRSRRRRKCICGRASPVTSGRCGDLRTSSPS